MPQLPLKQYANCFFESSLERNTLKETSRDAIALLSCFQDSKPFNILITHPAIESQDKIKILKNTLKNKIHDLTWNFILLMESRQRLILLQPILEKYLDQVYAYENRQSVSIIASQKLSDTQIENIQKHLSEKLDKSIESEHSIDSSLIGGLKLKIENTIYDFSVKHQLEKFKSKLLSA